jgi:hypothetical protein
MLLNAAVLFVLISALRAGLRPPICGVAYGVVAMVDSAMSGLDGPDILLRSVLLTILAAGYFGLLDVLAGRTGVRLLVLVIGGIIVSSI